jgi:molecular chaperone DnaK
LDNIPPAPRGVPQIEVTFDIDANGIISVSAKDKATGKEQKTRIEASSGLSPEEIERMKADAQANADADKQARERADVLNQADALLFQTEKQLGEFGDKIPADKRKAIDDAILDLKTAHTAQDVEGCKAGMERLNAAFQSASQDMYSGGGGDAGQTGGSTGGNAQSTADTEVTDVDFEEVK